MAVSEISVVDLARRTMYPRRQLASRFVNLASLFSPGNREEDRLVLVLPPFVFICPFAARRAVIRISLPDNRLLLSRRIYHHSLLLKVRSVFPAKQKRVYLYFYAYCFPSLHASSRLYHVFPMIFRQFVSVVTSLLHRRGIAWSSSLEINNSPQFEFGMFNKISDGLSVQDRLIMLFRRGRSSHSSCSNFCRAAIDTRGLALSW